MSYLTRVFNRFTYGIINTISDKKIPDGAYSNAFNFITEGNKVRLRRGYLILGTLVTGAASVLGLHVAYTADGTAVLFKKKARKLLYYDEDTSDWAETGTDMFPAAAANDDAFFANYQSNAGAQMFVCSPNSGPFKIMVANPGSYTDLTDSSVNFQGYIKIKYNRMFLWGRNKDKAGFYGSYIDSQNYTTESAEATASGGGTLAFKAAGATRTCFAVQITLTGSGEVYTDNYDGTLTGDAGGTGTINYTTGVYTISAAGVGTADYQWENSNDNGVTDFTKSGTRLAGEGFIFRQDDGGALMNIGFYRDSIYCVHEFKTWEVVLTADDTNATNLPFRERIGISSIRGMIDTASGIYLLNYADKKDLQIMKLAINELGTEVVPTPISKGRTLNKEKVGFDMSGFDPTSGVMFEWGDLILASVKVTGFSANNRTILFNKLSKALDVTDYYASTFENYNGTLVAGDSVSDNVYTLFSGLDDDGANIAGYVEFGLSDLQVENMKKTKRLIMEGNIGALQTTKVYLAVDSEPFVQVGTITGSGSYVDKGQAVTVGSVTVGKKEIGGGSDGIEAYHYLKEIKLALGNFYRVKIRLQPTSLGWFDVENMEFRKIKVKSNKVPFKYREN